MEKIGIYSVWIVLYIVLAPFVVYAYVQYRKSKHRPEVGYRDGNFFSFLDLGFLFLAVCIFMIMSIVNVVMIIAYFIEPFIDKNLIL